MPSSSRSRTVATAPTPATQRSSPGSCGPPSRSAADDHEQQRDLARRLTSNGGPTAAAPCGGSQAVQGHFEVEDITGRDLAAEAGPIDPPEQGQLAREPGIGQDGDGPELRERLDHQDPGEGGPARE